jgi:hypothetical protein
VQLNVDASFESLTASSAPWSNPSGTRYGHAVAVVGYDDSKSALLVQNSWGTGWGNNGQAWVDYNTLANNLYDNVSVIVGVDGSGTAAPTPTPSPSATPTPNTLGAFTPGPAVSPYPVSSSKTIYVATTDGNLYTIPEPLTASSTATHVAIYGPPAYQLAVDATGRLLVSETTYGNTTDGIAVYQPPLSATSWPLFVFGTLHTGSIAFDTAGDLVMSDMWDADQIDIYAPPITVQSAPAHTYFTYVQDSTLAVAGQRLLYTIENTEQLLDPPYTAQTSSFTLAGAGEFVNQQSLDPAGDLIVASSSGLTAYHYSYSSFSANTPPYATVGNVSPFGLGYDSQGHLLVGAGANLLVYNLPLTSNSAPALTLNIAGETGVISNIVAGP